jgi:hypothetical protein
MLAISLGTGTAALAAHYLLTEGSRRDTIYISNVPGNDALFSLLAYYVTASPAHKNEAKSIQTLRLAMEREAGVPSNLSYIYSM